MTSLDILKHLEALKTDETFADVRNGQASYSLQMQLQQSRPVMPMRVHSVADVSKLPEVQTALAHIKSMKNV